MIQSFEFHPQARAEFREGISFYESERPGLGGDFAAELRAAIEAILAFPRAGTPFDAGTRRRLLSRFPYSVIYLPETEPLIIVAVMLQRRRPGYWLTRVKGE